MPLLSHVSDYDWQIAFTLGETENKAAAGRLMPLELDFPRGSSEREGFKSVLQRWIAFEAMPSHKAILTPSTPHFEQVFQNTLTRNPVYYKKQMKDRSPDRHIDPERQKELEAMYDKNPSLEPKIGKGPYFYHEANSIEEVRKLEREDRKHHYFITGEPCHFPPFCSSNDERPLSALAAAIRKSHGETAPLFRPGGIFVSLIITNETSVEEVTAEDVISAFNRHVRPAGNKRLFAFSISVIDSNCVWREEGKKTDRIAALSEMTTGPEGNISICAKDYGPGLSKISQLIERLAENTVDVEEPFKPASLKVEFLKGQPVPWRLSGQRIFFESKITEHKEVKISYRPL